MKKTGIIIIFFCFVFNLHGQELTKNLTPRNQQFGFLTGYYGNRLIDPGIQIGAENYLATTPNYQVVASLHLDLFGKNNLYFAAALLPRIGLRYTSDFGLSLESHFGIGYIRRFYAYDQYVLNDNGDIVNTGKAGISSAMPDLAIGIGYDFSRIINLPVKLYIRPSCSLYVPAGHILFDASYAFEAGIIYVPTFN